MVKQVSKKRMANQYHLPGLRFVPLFFMFMKCRLSPAVSLRTLISLAKGRREKTGR
jgi:hypothetical protein